MKRLDFLYNSNEVFEKVVDKVMKDYNILHEHSGMGQILVSNSITDNQYERLKQELGTYGIRLVKEENEDLVSQMKSIMRMIVADGTLRKEKISVILAEKLDQNYAYLSKLFSRRTFMSIERFYLFLKIERAKEMLMQEGTTVSSVAFELDYSSTSHLSKQFKNMTGLTISQYLELIEDRK